MRVSLPTTRVLFFAMLASLGWLMTSGGVWAQEACQPACTWADRAPCSEGMPCIGGQAEECGPRWSFAAEAIALQRISTREQPLFSRFQTVLNSDPLNARNLDSSVTPGFEVSAIRHDICGYDLEIRYFQLDGFAAERNLSGSSYMVTDVNQTGFLVDNGRARYDSALYNGELNVRQQWSDCLTLLCGFRMLQLKEHYLAAGTEALATPRIDWLNTNTYNHLYGFQLGADILVYDMGGPLEIKALCRGGIYDNFASQNYKCVSAEGGTILIDNRYRDTRNQASFLGEAGLVATYAVTERLAFRASAEAIWITGVALAPEQIGGVNTRTGVDWINTSGAVFYYGGGLGVEYRF